MFYIEVQQIDYDDYPVGKPTNIGPFLTEEDAEKHMASSEKFHQRFFTETFYVWGVAEGAASRYSVNVKPVNRLFIRPGTEWF